MITEWQQEQILALRAQLAEVTRERDEARSENEQIRAFMTETGGDQLQSLADSLSPGVRALVGVFRLFRDRMHAAERQLSALTGKAAQ